MICFLSFPRNIVNVGLVAILANIKNHINFEPTAKLQEIRIYLLYREKIFPGLQKGKRRALSSLWIGRC